MYLYKKLSVLLPLVVEPIIITMLVVYLFNIYMFMLCVQEELSHWNITGSWKVQEGGHGTEKAFVTSYMECQKYQEVNLLEHFSAEYLDTAPPIQVSQVNTTHPTNTGESGEHYTPHQYR